MIARGLAPSLQRALRDTPVVFLQGARQVGKSTLVQSLFSNSSRRYLTLDDPTVLSAATTDPTGFLRGLGGPVTLDEVQRAPALPLAIKSAVDLDRTPGRFLLTGSAGVLVLPRLSDSLAGRMEILTLHPFSQSEITGQVRCLPDMLFAAKLDLPTVALRQRSLSIAKRLSRGGYPELLRRTAPDRRAAWFGSYLVTLLQRDVRDLANIEGISELPRLLSLLASRSSTLINYADVARTLGLAQNTLKRYLALLEGIFLIRLIPAWFTNVGKRFAKAPKLLLNDTGLITHLLGLSEVRYRSDPQLAGHVLETFVGNELSKHAGWSRHRITLHHFNVHQGDEVDFVLENEQGQVVGVEVKSTASISADHFKGLRALEAAAGRQFHRGVVLYGGSQVVPFAPNLHAVPLGVLWS
jgi:predicted AAA+ superfamily ATPase